MPQISDRMVPVIRNNLKRMSASAVNEPIARERLLQDFVGTIMQGTAVRTVLATDAPFPGFNGSMMSTESLDTEGVVMYIHGGGYCCGDLAYAKGYGRILAAETGSRVFCPAYRLAPEYPSPAALQDVFYSYTYLTKIFDPRKMVLIGESAGGGLLYCLCLALKEAGLPLPAGLIAISPWTDLTQAGDSYRENRSVDPSMTKELLDKFVSFYTKTPKDPKCSPLFGDLSGLPESLLFVGGDEVMRDDAVRMHKALQDAGCKSTLTIAPGMWHGYVLYGLKERSADADVIREFIRSIVK